MKTTYLLGAGASVHAIPVANKLKDKIPELIFSLEKYRSKYPNSSEYLIEKYYQLIERLEGHSTIDEMLISWKEKQQKSDIEHELESLKALTGFLILYLSWKSPVDYRYDVFVRSLLKESKDLPKTTSILNWNYDLQMEFALSKYKNLSFAEAQNMMLCLPRVGDLSEQFREFDANKFCVIKMNGTAGLYYNRNVSNVECNVNNYENFIAEDILCQINHWYGGTFSKIIHNVMTHTIENTSLRLDYIVSAKKITQETEMLIVIGYSFPHYNAVVDRELLCGMKNLKKIVIQDLNPSCVKEKLLMLLPNKKVTVETMAPDYFYVPAIE